MLDHCILCGRPITRPESIKRRMGPECAARCAEAADERRQLHFTFNEEKPMRGFIYRLGTRIKEYGETARFPSLIRFGCWLRDRV